MPQYTLAELWELIGNYLIVGSVLLVAGLLVREG